MMPPGPVSARRSKAHAEARILKLDLIRQGNRTRLLLMFFRPKSRIVSLCVWPFDCISHVTLQRHYRTKTCVCTKSPIRGFSRTMSLIPSASYFPQLALTDRVLYLHHRARMICPSDDGRRVPSTHHSITLSFPSFGRMLTTFGIPELIFVMRVIDSILLVDYCFVLAAWTDDLAAMGDKWPLPRLSARIIRTTVQRALLCLFIPKTLR